MRKLLVAVAVVSVALVGMPAGGHEAINRDPNDTEGQFDIRWTKLDHTANKLILKTKVTGELQKSDFGPIEGGVSQNYFSWRLDQGAAPSFITPAGEQFLDAFLHKKRVGGETVVNCFLFAGPFLVDKYPPVPLGDHVATCKIDMKDIAGVPDRWKAGSVKGSNTDTTNFEGHNV
jgi:hypothetical protein